MTMNDMLDALPTPPLFSVGENSNWIGVATLYVGVVRTHPDGSHEVLWYWEVLREQLGNIAPATTAPDSIKQITATIHQHIRGFSTSINFTLTTDFKGGTVKGESGEIALPPDLFGGTDHFKVLGMELSARRTNSQLRPQGRVKTPNLKNLTYPKPKVRKGQPRF